MQIIINRKVHKKLKSFSQLEITNIIKKGVVNFNSFPIVKPFENLSVKIDDIELADKIAELSTFHQLRQSTVIGSILTGYCSQFKGTETLYQSQLHHKYGGKREVKTPVGYIDLLTDNYIIEVKETNCWKSAVGQILCYDFYKTGRSKVIALFGKCNGKLKSEILYCCSNLDIQVWWL